MRRPGTRIPTAEQVGHLLCVLLLVSSQGMVLRGLGGKRAPSSGKYISNFNVAFVRSLVKSRVSAERPQHASYWFLQSRCPWDTLKR